ncbi:MAG TPA: YdeI/OmpD-associated family protein [Ignavibacteriaceae bacterium]|nr:YdeI/OmpD-associated family protein [Ignavibacteriaceae bacterium]
MEITKTLNIKSRNEWRKWLKRNYKTEKEIWLVFYNKSSDKKGVTYEEAVEEALCFGWIDSIVKKIEAHSRVQRFTPRNPKSSYSQLNKERLKKLIRKKKVVACVRKKLGDIENEKFIFPKDILNKIKKNKDAWKNFQKFSEAYKRIRIAFIDDARVRPDIFRTRLNYFLKMTTKNKQYGLKGIEKYL